MALDKDILEIKKGISELKERPLSVERAGLYIMVAITMCNSCDHGTDYAKKAYDKLNKSEVEERVVEKKVQLQLLEENICGNHTPEKFYMIDGQRLYLEVDGKPVDSYLPQQ